MELTKPKIKEFHKRFKAVRDFGGIDKASEYGKITPKTIHKILAGGNVEPASITAMVTGLEEVEADKQKWLRKNNLAVA